ncbi:hypothetical protein ACEWY4_001142 [Coilia grayii]|uniref:Uncharacterized protein n=1 Tax=Coilia grayii TaxID=363190 RepID=A0ABD1KYM7_9TELE
MSGQAKPDNVSTSTDIGDTAPLAVQAVLKKISETELARAKRHIVEEVETILARVNAAMCGLHMANSILEEENGKFDEQVEGESRMKSLADIKNFLNSTINKKNDLITASRGLENIADDFAAIEADKNFIEVDNITQAWVARKEADVFAAMSNIESGVLRLRQLCGKFFTMRTNATKKEHAEKKVNDVWCWWKETRVDARMLMKIQEMQPPSTESMLKDALLGHKAATDLSFMLEDMAKALAHNKAMKLAFQFAQTGLSNLSRALKERSHEVQALQNEVDKVQAKETLAEVEKLLNKLNLAKARTTQLIHENNALKGNNGQLLKQIEELKSQLLDEKAISTALPTSAHAPAKPKHKQPKQEQVQIQPTPETQIIYVEKDRCEKQAEPVTIPVVSKEELKDEEEQGQEEVSVFLEVEKESKKLQGTFQVYVFDLVKKALEKNMPDELNQLELDDHRANDAIQLYHILQSNLHSTFEKIMSNMNISFTSGIVDLPVKDEHLQPFQFVDNEAIPGQMLQDISKSMKTSDEDFASVSKSVKGLQENLGDQARDVYQQLQNTHDKSKKQSCKMRLVLENLVEVYNDIHSQPREDTEKKPLPQKRHSPHLPPVAEKPKLRQLSPPKKLSPKIPPKVRKTPIMKTNTPQSLEVPQIPAKPFRELLERYEKELLSEPESILKDEGRGGKYQLRMECHLTNLRVLHQALLKEDISTELYCLAKDLIKYCMNINEMRLASLVRKFIAHQTLERVRSNLNARVFSAREHNDGLELRDLYMFLVKMEWYKSSVMKRWNARQMTIEDERQTCLAKILHLFRQFELDLGMTLVKPYICAVQSQVQFPTIKSQFSLNVGCYHHARTRVTPLSFLIKTEPSVLPQPCVREICTPTVTATWNFDVTMDNMQLASKKPVMLSVPPTFPRLREMDIAQGRQRALRTAQAR